MALHSRVNSACMSPPLSRHSHVSPTQGENEDASSVASGEFKVRKISKSGKDHQFEKRLSPLEFHFYEFISWLILWLLFLVFLCR